MSGLTEAAVDTEAQKAVREEIKALENQKKKPRKPRGTKKTPQKTGPSPNSKSKGAKRKLEKDFNAAASEGLPSGSQAAVVASPKAKRMAGRISEEDRIKANESRKDKACSALAELGLFPLDGLQLPDVKTFDKM